MNENKSVEASIGVLYTPELIDWNEMWKQARQNASWRTLEGPAWDGKAKRYKEWVKVNTYATQFLLSRIKMDTSSTVRDIGCGPGNLAVPLAKNVERVTALAISKEALKYVRENTDKEKLNNIRCVNKRWEDVVIGEDVDFCDVVIASRSLVWFDLKEALSKIDWAARQAVYLTRPVTINPRPFYEGAYRAVGRKYKPVPDYIYVYNLLYQMGIYANVVFFESESKIWYSDMDEAMEDWRWKMEKLKPHEKEKLRAYLVEHLEERNRTLELNTESRSKEALIWWEKGNRTERSVL